MTSIGRGRLLVACPAPVVAKEMRAGRDLHGLTQDALQMICPSGKTSRILLRSCIWPASKSVARKLRFGQAFQRDLGRPVCCAEINRSACRANHRYNLSPSHPSEGRFAIVTDAGWDAVDAAASGAKRVRRAVSPVSEHGAQDERRCCVRQNRVVPTPVAGAKLRGGEVNPTGFDQPLIRQRRRQDEFVSGESAA